MAYLTNEFVKFFKELEKNNNREWFNENKKRYENFVKEPFLQLLDDLVPLLIKLEPEISLNPKDALFRINRDIRFSKDKTPYNTMMKAGFAPGGKKSFLPGFYLGIDKEKIYMGGGLYNLQSPELKKVRSHLAANLKEFVKIIESKNFKEKFKELKGEKAKRIDKELQEALSKSPYIANKQFYAMADFPLKDYLNSEKILNEIFAHFKVISKLNHFLKKAFN